MLDKTFDPKATEPRLYAAWEASGAFSPDHALTRDPAAKPFCIVIPPPNVTGSLHVGHALNGTLQDVLARFHRMRGEAVLWLPGTDHAGIATQMIVERQLAAEGNMGRRELGRDAFVERVWKWKGESGGTIVEQLRRLGASCDWSRERFTLDEGLSAAVRKVFVSLYKEGLIYRDKRLVNWDPQFQSAISDLEVETREVQGKMWHFAYPLEGDPIDGVSEIVIATTRPETMLGDGAVAVHPDDERYTKFVGRMVRLPIADRLIPVISDIYPDPEKGSGAVKITGAHDFNDYQVAKRHGLPLISIMDEQARMVGPIPERYVGCDRYVARKMVVDEIEGLGLLREIEEKVIAQPFGDRSGVVIEPFLTDQWYVDAKTLAGPAIAAVEDGRTVFEPRNWERTYFEWMRNIEPWCISRQLWWGHRIPVWFGIDTSSGLQLSILSKPKEFVEETEEQALKTAREYYGKPVHIVKHGSEVGKWFFDLCEAEEVSSYPIFRDPDVLDTWFSSALWPFSTLGWPESADDLKRFYPTDTLVTSFDIIFFWVARMMMMGLHFRDDVPFRRVFINALVRDELGQKMSKTRGNVIDPLALVDQYGADALRFTLTAMSGQARDIRLSTARVEGYRNFGTKLWNAARFGQINGCTLDPAFDPASARLPLNRWLRGEVVRTAHAVTTALEACAFDQAAEALYRFIWNSFCDWHLELAKPILNGDDAAARDETRATTAWALDQALRLLHPVSPFLTEALWEQTALAPPSPPLAPPDLIGGRAPGSHDGKSESPHRPPGQAGGSEANRAGRTEGGRNLLIEAAWPDLPLAWIDREADTAIQLVIAIVGEGRSVRSELNMPPSAKPPLIVVEASDSARAVVETNTALIVSTLRVGEVRFEPAPPGAVQFVVEGVSLALPFADYVDLAAERGRLGKAIAAAQSDAERVLKKLDNPQFMAKAPEAVVAENRAKLAEAEAACAKLAAALSRLGTVS